MNECLPQWGFQSLNRRPRVYRLIVKSSDHSAIISHIAQEHLFVHAIVCACLCVCMPLCVPVCVRACVRVCVREMQWPYTHTTQPFDV